MKKTDVKAFIDFMGAEGVKYGRDITKPEILTWFETFPRVALEDFKAAWEQHRKGQWGGRFPTPNDLLRLTKTAGIESVARDWRCSAEVNGDRCGFPGGINVGYGPQCAAHYRLKGGASYTDEASLQIIAASRDYVAPKTALEAMERGAAQRAAEGERWRKSRPELYAGTKTQRLEADAIAPTVPAKPEEPDGPPLEDVPLPDFVPAEEAS